MNEEKNKCEFNFYYPNFYVITKYKKLWHYKILIEAKKKVISIHELWCNKQKKAINVDNAKCMSLRMKRRNTERKIKATCQQVFQFIVFIYLSYSAQK